jgi:hypothetical protein
VPAVALVSLAVRLTIFAAVGAEVIIGHILGEPGQPLGLGLLVVLEEELTVLGCR